MSADGDPHTGSRVLVVDDNPFVRRLISSRLRQAGCAVSEAPDGVAALGAFRKSPVQVVITDINMPNLRGLDLLAALRAEEVPPEVILLTGTHAADAAAAVAALRLGAHDYIAKDATASEAVLLAVERALSKWRLREENTRLLAELQRLSLSDPLTGAGNRRACDAALTAEVSRARRQGGALSVVMADLDHFKRVNDTWGHGVGDEVLAKFVDRIRGVIRAGDHLYRIGGEEFVIIVPGTDAPGAITLAWRAIAEVASSPIETARGPIRLTCSAGVSTLTGADDQSGKSLLARADEALYAAKANGRGRAESTAAALNQMAPAGA